MTSFPLPPPGCPSLSQEVCLLFKSVQPRRQGGDAPAPSPQPTPDCMFSAPDLAESPYQMGKLRQEGRKGGRAGRSSPTRLSHRPRTRAGFSRREAGNIVFILSHRVRHERGCSRQRARRGSGRRRTWGSSPAPARPSAAVGRPGLTSATSLFWPFGRDPCWHRLLAVAILVAGPRIHSLPLGHRGKSGSARRAGFLSQPPLLEEERRCLGWELALRLPSGGALSKLGPPLVCFIISQGT